MLYKVFSLATSGSLSVVAATIPAMSAQSVASSALAAMPEFHWRQDVFIGYWRQHSS
jgi:hypothetical protein